MDKQNSHFELQTAINTKNEKRVQELLNSGSDGDALGEDGRSPLMCAVQANAEKIVLLLLTRGVQVDQENQHGITPLMMAALKGTVRICFLLVINGADFRKTNAADHSAWSKAANHGRIDVLKFFQQRGLSVNEKSAKNNTLLMSAAAANQAETVEWLLTAQGVLVQEKNEEGLTAYELAKKNNRAEVMKLFEKYFPLLASQNTTPQKSEFANDPIFLLDVNSAAKKRKKRKKALKADISKSTEINCRVTKQGSASKEKSDIMLGSGITSCTTTNVVVLPLHVATLLKKIEAKSNVALYVGECVIDLLLNNPPKYYEIITNCSYSELENHLNAYQKRHVNNSLRVYINSDYIDINIQNFSDIKEVAKKANFTVDALYLNSHGFILDPLESGISDLTDKKLKLVTSDRGIEEKTLFKALRAVGLHVKYDFILPDGFNSVEHTDIKSCETVLQSCLHTELRNQFLHGKAVKHFNALLESNLFNKIFPSTSIQLESVPYYQDWLVAQLSQTDQCVSSKIPVSFHYVLALFYVGQYVSPLPEKSNLTKNLTQQELSQPSFFYANEGQQSIKLVIDTQDPFARLKTNRVDLIKAINEHILQHQGHEIIAHEILELYTLNKLPVSSQMLKSLYGYWHQSTIAVNMYCGQLLDYFSQWIDPTSTEQEVLTWLSHYQWANEFQQLCQLTQERNFSYYQLQQYLTDDTTIKEFLDQLLQFESVHIGWRLFFLYANYLHQSLTILCDQPEETRLLNVANTFFEETKTQHIVWRDGCCIAVKEEILPKENLMHLQNFFQIDDEAIPKLESQIKKLSKNFLISKSQRHSVDHLCQKENTPLPNRF